MAVSKFNKSQSQCPLIKKSPQFVIVTGPGRGIRCNEAPIPNSKDAGRRRLPHHRRGWWNEMNDMSVEKWWNEICRREEREKLREKPSQTAFCPPRNLQAVTETWTRDPSGRRRAPRRLRHGAGQYI